MHGETGQAWVDQLLAQYPGMMALQDVAAVLNVEPRKLRVLIRHPDPNTRITATKIHGAWRIPKTELAAYLLAHTATAGALHA